MQVAISRPRTIRWRRALFQMHLWVGLISGLYVLVVCVTGAALVFRIELQKAAHPQLFTPSANAPLAAPITILDEVRRAYPHGRVAGVDAPTTARPTYLAYVTTGAQFATVLIDPVTARVLGELPERSLVRTVQELHFDLLAGRTGRIVNGIGAGCLLIMCVTGLVIWWPRVRSWRRAFTIDVRGQWRRAIWDVHGITGMGTMAFLIVVSLSGLSFTFPSAFRAAVSRLSPITEPQAPLSAPSAGSTPRLSWRDLIDRARARAPGRHVARVVVPATDRAAFLVLFSDDSPTPMGHVLMPVYLDQFTGDVLTETSSASRTAGDQVMAWMGPLHVGNFGGTGVKIAWLLLGLAPPLLFATGFVLWWTRVVRPRARATA